ncbi:hypothetical protein BS78_10G008600 [Paspalum vaginatum]|nr:hypothetical protein BS78_10G008600 [Paspalum vaginatum]
MLFLRRHLVLLLRAAASPLPSPSPIHHRACLLSTSAAPFSLEDYLVDACGLSPAQARKTAEKAVKEASKKASGALSVSRLNSAGNPDAVRALLCSIGLSPADIASVVAADPLILRCSVKIIKPRLLALRDRVGLSPPQIARLLIVAHRALRCSNVEANVEFLMSFYGSFDKVLVATKRTSSLLAVSLEKLIQPNIALLRQCGVPDIPQLCINTPWVLTYSLERVKEFLLRAEQLGVPPKSPMFKYAMGVVTFNPREKVAAKLDFFKRTLGCSQSEVSLAVPKLPQILSLSDDNLLRHFEFLVNEVGMERRYILERPVLFGLSLEKRLVPRHYVMKVLQAKGLLNSNMSFYSLAIMGEENFRLKFIDCHRDSVPGLADDYAAARAGAVPSRV